MNAYVSSGTVETVIARIPAERCGAAIIISQVRCCYADYSKYGIVSNVLKMENRNF